VTIGGNERHIVGYLRDFLFTPEQIQGAITRLSGGERRRLQLAKVLSRPSNLLVLDEPTNDLDLETLELLEDLLVEFQGTLLVVSHDRAFLDNVVSSTLVAEAAGRWSEYVGGYTDWLRQRAPSGPPPTPARPRTARPAAPKSRRMSFKEKRELETLPGTIERLEARKQEVFALMSSPTFYQTPAEEIARARDELEALEREIHESYVRWTELEALAAEEADSR